MDSLRGIKNDILRQAPGGLWYLGELKRTRLEPKMGHLTCFAGGMFALGSKHMKSQKDKDYWMDMAKNIGETCHESYKKSPTGGFLIMNTKFKLLIGIYIIEHFPFYWNRPGILQIRQRTDGRYFNAQKREILHPATRSH